VEPCATAIAAGDGREVWQNLPNGQLSNVAGKKCVGLRDNDVSDGGIVALMDCDQASAAGDARSTWESLGSGQLKLGRAGQYCLSQEGSEAGVEDAAEKAAIVASNSADVQAHGASMAVDGRSSTFWASALDPSESVALTVDFGTPKKIQHISIQWEYLAKSFTVSLTADGVKWQEVFATDSNVLGITNVPTGLMKATKARVVMQEAHATSGMIQGHAVYGIKKLAVYSPRLRSMVEDCAEASKSHDARDKYFQTYVSESASCSSKALRSELPSLEAAQASLAATASELVDILPNLSSCRRAASSFRKGVLSRGGGQRATKKNKQTLVADSTTSLGPDIEKQNNIDFFATRSLMSEARAAIIAVRQMIF